MMNPETVSMLKETLGISDAEAAELAPRVEGVLARRSEMAKVRIIAEVMSSVNCLAGVKKGHKLVFNVMPFTLNTEETTCPLCVRALTPVLVPAHGMWELALSGTQNTPRGQARVAECMDPGVDWGGLGHVRFKVNIRTVG